MGAESSLRQKSGFSNVDEVDDGAGWFKLYLEKINRVPAIRRYKQYELELINPQMGEHILDVGCGLGLGLQAIRSFNSEVGRLVGIDNSQSMVSQAIASTSRDLISSGKFSFLQEDAHNLAFRDEIFDVTYADRTFQHLSNPKQAFEEMLRVTKKDGRIIIADTDWTTLQLKGISGETAEKIKRAYLRIIVNPLMGSELQGLFTEHGLKDLTVIEVPLDMPNFRTLDTVLALKPSLELAGNGGFLSGEDVDQVLEDVRQARKSIQASVSIYIAKGKKQK